MKRSILLIEPYCINRLKEISSEASGYSRKTIIIRKQHFSYLE